MQIVAASEARWFLAKVLTDVFLRNGAGIKKVTGHFIPRKGDVVRVKRNDKGSGWVILAGPSLFEVDEQTVINNLFSRDASGNVNWQKTKDSQLTEEAYQKLRKK